MDRKKVDRPLTQQTPLHVQLAEARAAVADMRNTLAQERGRMEMRTVVGLGAVQGRGAGVERRLRQQVKSHLGAKLTAGLSSYDHAARYRVQLNRLVQVSEGFYLRPGDDEVIITGEFANGIADAIASAEKLPD